VLAAHPRRTARRDQRRGHGIELFRRRGDAQLALLGQASPLLLREGAES
jgi:hypothetical protein